MKLSRKEIIRYIFVLGIIILSIIPVQLLRSSLASEENYSLTAVLYDTEQYSAGGSGIALTSAGATVSDWTMNTSKYLKIDPTVPADGNTYKVKIILPKEMYIVSTENTLPLQTGYSNVTFSKNSAITINGGKSSYALEKYSGTATYTMEYMGISGTLQLEIRYDANLWDEQKNSAITSTGVKPIIVQLIKEESGVESNLQEVSVAKITSGVALASSGYLTYAIGTSTTTTTGAVELLVGNTINTSFSYTVNDQNSGKGVYFEELRIQIKLPEYTYNGTKYYLGIDESTIAFSSPKGGCNYTKDTSRVSTEGILTLTIPNAYFTRGGKLFGFRFNDLPADLQALDNSKFPMLFSSGYIRLYGDSVNGTSNIQIRNSTLPNITYIKEAQAKITINASNRTGNNIVSYWERPRDTETAYGGAVSSLGGGQIANNGTGDSGAKKFKYVFDTGTTGKMQVTTIRVHADTVQQKMKIKYTLVDEGGVRVFLDSSGNRVTESTEGAIGEWEYEYTNSHYNSTAKNLDNISNIITRSMLPISQRQYYFKTVEYTLQKILANAKLYASGGPIGVSSAGNFFGYVSDDFTNQTDILSTFTMYNPNTDEVELTRTITTRVGLLKTTAYGIQSVAINKTSIIAGEDCVISGKIVSSEYPYGSCGWLRHIRLGVLLPGGITIVPGSITAATSTNKTISGITITSKEVGDGKVLWTLAFPDDAYIGYAKENLSALAMGNSIQFSMQLNTSAKMNATTLFGREMLFATGVEQENKAGGGWNWASTIDTYDLNENGKTTDKIGGVNSTNNPSCQIISENATLDVTNKLSVTSGGTTTESTSEVISSADDIINYNLELDSKSGGTTTNFSYYIPIPKNTSTVDNFIISQKQFDLKLIEAVSFTGGDLFNIQYSFNKNLTYNTAKNEETWYTSEQIENDSTLNYEDVTMIKLTTKNDYLKNGDKSILNFKLKYAGSDFNAEAGMVNIWASAGQYVYTNGDRETEGNYPTEAVTLSMKYNYTNEDITLTAAKDRNPTVVGNVNTITINKNLFPEFKNAHSFSITSVDNYGVELQTKAYMQSNVDMVGTDANKKFAITVKLNSENEVDILKSNEAISVGTSSANTAPEFIYTLYNADKLSDNSTSRYIVVTLTSDNGVTYEQKIIINRELTQAIDPKSAIIGGKNYIAFDDTSDTTTISGDSAFTVQMVTTYIPSVYKNHKIIFSTAMPKGTEMTLIDITNSSSPKYYYYEADGIASTIEFSDFIKMGTTATKDYAYYTQEDTIDEKLLLIVDISKADAGYMSNGTYSIKMKMESDTVDDYETKQLTFITTSVRGFEISSESATEFGTDFTVNYEVSSQNGIESKYEGKKVSLVITMPSAIPIDTNLNINGTKYNLNADRQFIVTLGDIQETSSSILMQFLSDMLPTIATSYNCNVALWTSATANGTKPILGEKVAEKNITINVNSKPNPSLKITGMSSRIIHKSELNNNIIINYKYNKDSSCTVTIELMQKIGSGYQKITDKLASINNVTSHTMGAFAINPVNGNNTVTADLSSNMEVGTYRFMIRVKDGTGNELLNIPYNFLVVDD